MRIPVVISVIALRANAPLCLEPVAAVVCMKHIVLLSCYLHSHLITSSSADLTQDIKGNIHHCVRPY